MDIPKFIKQNLDKNVTNQQIISKKLCQKCYETLFEVNEYQKRIQNSLKHIDAIKSKIKSAITQPDSPSYPSDDDEKEQEEQEEQEDQEEEEEECKGKQEFIPEENQASLGDEDAFSSQDELGSLAQQPVVSEDETTTFAYMDEQEDEKMGISKSEPYSIFELEATAIEGLEIDKMLPEEVNQQSTGNIQIVSLTEIDVLEDFLVNDSDNNGEEPMIVFNNDEYAASQTGYSIIEYDDDYSQADESIVKNEENDQDQDFMELEDLDSQSESTFVPGKTLEDLSNKLLFELIQSSFFKCMLCPPTTEDDEYFVGIDCFEQDTLVEHLVNIHQFEKDTCLFCDLNFSTISEQTLHIVNQHSAKTEIIKKCPENDCGLNFASILGLKQHQSKHHEPTKTRAKSHVCDICSRSFASRAVLNEHKNMHSGKEIEKKIIRLKINYF